MPFDKLKKLFNKKNDRAPLLEDGSGPSKQEVKIEKIKEENELFLKKYNLDKKNKDNFYKYVEKEISNKATKDSKEIEEYFAAQIECLNNFQDILQQQFQLEKDIKTAYTTSSHFIALWDQKLTEMNSLEKHYVDQYSRNRENIRKKIGFEDKGPYLTKDGLVLS